MVEQPTDKGQYLPTLIFRTAASVEDLPDLLGATVGGGTVDFRPEVLAGAVLSGDSGAFLLRLVGCRGWRVASGGPRSSSSGSACRIGLLRLGTDSF